MEVSGEGARGRGAAIHRTDVAEEMGIDPGVHDPTYGRTSLGQAIDKVARGEDSVETGSGARRNPTLLALLRESPDTVTVASSTTPAAHAGTVDLALGCGRARTPTSRPTGTTHPPLMRALSNHAATTCLSFCFSLSSCPREHSSGGCLPL